MKTFIALNGNEATIIKAKEFIETYFDDDDKYDLRIIDENIFVYGEN